MLKNKVLIFILLITTIVSTTTLIVISGNKLQDVELKKYNIQITLSDTLKFVTTLKVEEWLYSESCEASIGMNIENVNMRRIEEFISTQPFVDSVNVTKDIFGVLHINITQVEPLFRIFDTSGDNFYIDKNYNINDYNGDFVEDVLIVTCDTTFSSKIKKNKKNCIIYDKFFNFVNWVSENSFWNSQIAGINITASNIIEIYPRFGNHKIKLCHLEDVKNYKTYLSKLNALYDNQINKPNWDKYSFIDLSYDEMIICKIK